MPRPLRIQFKGAIYHVMNRGNYRKNLFTVGRTAEAFEDTLAEACLQCGWKVHAYVIMKNHYHLVVETPQPNLVDGMHWVQATFANRFNRFTGEQGHVFQGRYKALLVEPGEALLSVVSYVHLNPVRAKLCSLDELKDGYAHCSYGKFFQKKRPAYLVRERFLGELGLSDTLRGMKAYAKWLALRDEQDPKQRDRLYKQYCRGWLIGDSKYRDKILRRMDTGAVSASHSGDAVRDLRQRQWESELKQQLKSHGKTARDIKKSKKAEPWKVDIARHMRKQTRATNPWLAERLQMGHPSRVSNLIHGRET